MTGAATHVLRPRFLNLKLCSSYRAARLLSTFLSASQTTKPGVPRQCSRSLGPRLGAWRRGARERMTVGFEPSKNCGGASPVNMQQAAQIKRSDFKSLLPCAHGPSCTPRAPSRDSKY